MSFFGTIISLGAALCAVLTAYFFGHGLSNGEARAFVISATFATISAVLGFAQVRFARGGAAEHR